MTLSMHNNMTLLGFMAYMSDYLNISSSSTTLSHLVDTVVSTIGALLPFCCAAVIHCPLVLSKVKNGKKKSYLLCFPSIFPLHVNRLPSKIIYFELEITRFT